MTCNCHHPKPPAPPYNDVGMWDEVYMHTPTHNTVLERDEEDCHPIKAITGLEDKLNEMEDKIPAIQHTVTPVETGNLLVLNNEGNLVDSGRCCSTIPTTEEVSTLARAVDEIATTFVYNPPVPSKNWHIIHKMNRIPSVITTDSNGGIIIGEVLYPNMDEVVIIFSEDITGTAYLN